MQRPSTRIIKEYGIVDQFLRNNIVAVFNLQEQGEHPHCGDRIDEVSGFSYTSSGMYTYIYILQTYTMPLGHSHITFSAYRVDFTDDGIAFCK